MLNELKYLSSFIFPLCVLAFVITGPHSPSVALLWTLPLWFMVLLDWLSPRLSVTHKSHYAPEVYYDVILYALALLQFLIIGFMLHTASQLSWESGEALLQTLVNLIVLRILVGTSSGSSAIIVAHELIHRRSSLNRLLGKMLLYTVCYEHFMIAHLHNHHPHVASQEDIATARHNENFDHYWRRVYSDNFKFAWTFEQNRLNKQADHRLSFWHNKVLQGILIEISLTLLIVIIFGWLAAFIFLYQALAGVRLLETINYHQHWGLDKCNNQPAVAWSNPSSFTHYALIGLAKHIGHHQFAQEPYYRIPNLQQGPELPYGYFVTNLWVKLNNRHFCQTAQTILSQWKINHGC